MKMIKEITEDISIFPQFIIKKIVTLLYKMYLYLLLINYIFIFENLNTKTFIFMLCTTIY